MCELTTAGVRPPGQLDGRTPRPDQTHQDEVADSVVSAIHLVKETDRSKRWLGRDRLSTEEYGMSTALSHWLLNGYGNKGSEMFDWSNMEKRGCDRRGGRIGPLLVFHLKGEKVCA